VSNCCDFHNNNNKHPRSPRTMSESVNFDRENKIRIVEKLGNVQSALTQVSSLQEPFKSISSNVKFVLANNFCVEKCN
jgi:hypothetical protein